MQEIVNKIFEFTDIQSTIRELRKFQKQHKVDYKKMEQLRIKEIKGYELVPSEESRHIKDTKGIYMRKEKALVLEMLKSFFAGEVRDSQIKLNYIFDFITEKMEILDEEFHFGFDHEDYHNTSLEIMQVLFQNISAYTQSIRDQEEMDIIKALQEAREKKAKETKEFNRTFGRETKVNK